MQWFGIASISWNVLMAYHMSSWIVRRKHPKRIEKTVKEYIVIIFTLSGVLALILLGINSYSDSYIWCWIDSEKKYLRIFCFDIILLMSWIVVIVSLFQVNRSVQNRKRNNNLLMNRLNKLLDNDRIIQKKLMLYVSIFIFTWFFMILNRLYETAAERTSFTLSLLEVIFLPLQGFWNSLIYGELLAKNYYYNLLVDYLKKWNNNVNNLIHNTNYPVIDNNKLIYVDNSVELKEVLVEIPKSKSEYSNSIISTLKYRPKYYSIFCTTLNMGEAPADSITAALENWILPGHEIYCIGLQECMELQSVRSLILQRLGGADSYHMFTSEIGSDNTRLGYHGYIALTIFVRMECIRAGEVYQTKASSERSATGTNLLITTAENKGAVGIPLQIHDTSIVFLTAHLPSDSKGISKLSKRNASAHRILKDLSLAEEDIGFDVHFQHDHIMLMGDLNYRMRNEVGGGVSALTGVAVASLIEKHTLNDDRNWLARKYNMLQYKYPNLPENRHEMQLIKAAKSSSKGAWTSVLRLDELRSIMIDGDAFCNFGEPMPCFPPSYKRKIGAEADCGDYTDPFQVIRGYTNTGEIEEELAFLQTTVNSNNPIRSLTLGKDALEYLARESAIALADDEIDVTVVESSNLDKIFGSVDDFDEKTNEKSTKVGIDDGLVREDFGEVNPMQVTKKSSVLEKSVPSILRTASSDSPKSPGKSLMFADVDSRKNSIAAGEERGSRGVSFAQDSIDSFEQEDIRESSVEETGSSDDARDRSSGSGDNSKSKKRRKAAISPHNSESPDNSQKPSLITKILPKAIDAKKLRRPSYTDRILIHSLPDREERLKVQAYDSCDLMRISDHRPVSMTTVLMVMD